LKRIFVKKNKRIIHFVINKGCAMFVQRFSSVKLYLTLPVIVINAVYLYYKWPEVKCGCANFKCVLKCRWKSACYPFTQFRWLKPAVTV